MFFRNILVWGIVLAVCIWVLKLYHIIGANTGAERAVRAQKQYQEEQKAKEKKANILLALKDFCLKVGGPLSDKTIHDWDYRILRLHFWVKELDRFWKTEELVGLLRLIRFTVSMISVGGLLLQGSPFWLILFILINLASSLFAMFCDMKVKAQDIELERDFPAFYNMISSQLEKGGIIQGSVHEYMTTLDVIYTKSEHKVIKQFVKDINDYIAVYADESTALRHIRSKYHSAAVLNFTNLAIQSASGTDNRDKILAFRIELQSQALSNMQKIANERVEKASRSVIVIYMILVQFVILTWITRVDFSKYL